MAKANLFINGQRLIDRTVELFHRLSSQVYIITHRLDVANPHASSWVPPARSWKCQTLLSTTPLWPLSKPLIVVHGDVYFTRDCRDKMIEWDGREIAFFWDTQEVFGLVAPGPMQQTLERYVRLVVERTHKKAKDNDCGLAGLLTAMQASQTPVTAIPIADETQDFDTPDEYFGWQMGWRKNKLRQC